MNDATTGLFPTCYLIKICLFPAAACDKWSEQPKYETRALEVTGVFGVRPAECWGASFGCLGRAWGFLVWQGATWGANWSSCMHFSPWFVLTDCNPHSWQKKTQLNVFKFQHGKQRIKVCQFNLNFNKNIQSTCLSNKIYSDHKRLKKVWREEQFFF